MSIYACLDLERVLWGVGGRVAVAPGREFVRRCLSALPSVVFDRIDPHVSHRSVFSLVETCRAREIDLLVPVGGGSPIDTAKVALLALAAGVKDASGLTALRVPRRTWR